MREETRLTRRETQVAELIAWGATKKDVARMLDISVRTVENIARSIFEKTEVTKANELSAWWFCSRYHISLNMSPLRRAISTLSLVIMITAIELSSVAVDMRPIRTRSIRQTTRIVKARARRKQEDSINYYNYLALA